MPETSTGHLNVLEQDHADSHVDLPVHLRPCVRNPLENAEMIGFIAGVLLGSAITYKFGDKIEDWFENWKK